MSALYQATLTCCLLTALLAIPLLPQPATAASRPFSIRILIRAPVRVQTEIRSQPARFAAGSSAELSPMVTVSTPGPAPMAREVVTTYETHSIDEDGPAVRVVTILLQ